MLNAPLYRNGIPKDEIQIDRIQTAVTIKVNGRTETFDPDEALMFLMDECGLSYSEAVRRIGD